MGLMADRFVGQFEQHRIDVVRTNLDKRVVVLVDGNEVIRESVALPHDWVRSANTEVGACGKTHRLVARSSVRRLFGAIPIDNRYVVEIDGVAVPLSKTS